MKNKEILLVWQGYNEKSTGTFVDIEERTVVYLDTEPIWAELQSLKSKIIILQVLNEMYRKELGILENPVDLDNVVC